MIRATIIVRQPEHILEVLQKIEEDHRLAIIRIKNKLNEEFKIVEINVIYQGAIIGEIRIQYGTVPP